MWSETMTPGERMMSLHETGWADRPAVGAFAQGLIAKMTPGLTIGECYEDQVKFAKAYLKVWKLFGFDTGPLFGHACFGAAEFGGTLEYPGPTSRAQSPIIKSYPVDTPEKVEAAEVPDPATAGEVEKFCKAARYVLENYPDEYKAPTVVAASTFTISGNIVGVETLLLWMIRDPDLVNKILGKVSDFQIEMSRYVVDTVAPTMLFDGGTTESNDLISPAQFKEFALPYIVKVREGALKAGIPGFLCHPCGDHTGNIDMWIEPPGTFGINFDYRTPLEKCVEVLGPSAMVVGNIEPAKFMYSDYDWIYNTTMDCMKMAAPNCPHGYCVGPGCEMPIDTPAIHLSAMMEATRDYAQSKEWQERKPR